MSKAVATHAISSPGAAASGAPDALPIRISLPTESLSLPFGMEHHASPDAGAGDATTADAHLIIVPLNTPGPGEALEQASSQDELGEDYGDWSYDDTGTVLYGDGVVYGPHGGGRRWRGPGGVKGSFPQRPGAGHRTRDDGQMNASTTDGFRRAELFFGQNTYPQLQQTEDAFARARFQFHQATVTPGVQRQADGLQHEQVGSSGGSNGLGGRTPPSGRPRPTPHR